MGDGWSIAWRTYEASMWGVPQRRLRIYLVADFAGERASEILFKQQGLSGDLEPSIEAWQSVAGNASGRANGSCESE